jgi:hypothetical protein
MTMFPWLPFHCQWNCSVPPLLLPLPEDIIHMQSTEECMAELQETFLVKVKSILSPHLLDLLQIGSVLLRLGKDFFLKSVNIFFYFLLPFFF